MRVPSAFIVICLAATAGLGVALVQPANRTAIRGPAAPSATPSPGGSARLLFVGDIQLSRAVGDLMARTDDWTWPFARVASGTRAADIAFGNLESMIATSGTNAGCVYCFRADPRALEGLLFAGFDAVSVANNHVWDHGPDAFTETLFRLASAGIHAVGGGRTLAQAREPVLLRAGGTSIAFLAFTDLLPASACASAAAPGANCADAVRMAEDIARAATMADLVVVSFHTGTEYEPFHDARQERWYHAAVDAGADLVIGHHPHVVQDIERYREATIVYSLGNFIFDQGWSAPTMRGMAVDATVRDGRLVSIATRSVDISAAFQASWR